MDTFDLIRALKAHVADLEQQLAQKNAEIERLRGIIETAMLHIAKMRSNHLDIDPVFLMNTLRPGSSMQKHLEEMT